MSRGARLLVIGLDGATWSVLDDPTVPLPTLRRLIAGGAAGTLASTMPPMTLPAWSSILTGVNPGVHGILDFTHRPPGSYGVAFLNATHRRVPTLHELLSARGRRVASLTVPGTWPPRPVNGVMVSGFDSPVATRAERGHCLPTSVYDTLSRRFGGVRFADFQETALGEGWHDRARDALLREVGRREAIARFLLDQERWDLFMVVFGESDTAAHHFWAQHDAASPRHVPGHARVLTEVYARLDAAVERLAHDAELVCIVSDHGFGGAGTLALYLNNYLAEMGWLRPAEGMSAGAGDRARRAALRLPVERLVRRLPASVLGRVETGTRYGAVDFSQTRAWSDELSYAPSIHLNVRGRDPLGTIDDVSAATDDLTRLLYAWRVDGRPVVARVWRRDEVCQGEAAAGAPDLVLELAEEGGYTATLLPSARVARTVTSRRLTEAEYPGGKGLGTNGTHRRPGVLVLHGPAFVPGARVSGRVEDVLPTLCAALGEAVPDHVEGRVIAGALRSSIGVPPSAGETPVAPSSPSSPSSPRAWRATEEAGLRRRLVSLGYL